MTEREATPEDVLSLSGVAEQAPDESVESQIEAVGDAPDTGDTVPADDAQ